MDKEDVMPNSRKLAKNGVDKGGRQGFHCIEDKCGKLFYSKRIFMIHMKRHEKTKENRDGESDTEEEEANACHLATNSSVCKEFQKNPILFQENPQEQGLSTQKTCLFCSKNGVRQHLTSHSNIRIHSCSKCEKSFKNSSSLNYHNKRVHSGSDYLKHKCSQPSCGKTTDSGGILRIHHSATPANQCNFCRKLFESREKLLEHVRESGHNKEKEFSCVICSQHFSLRKCLQKHLKTNSHIVKESLYKITVNNKEMLKDLVKNRMYLTASFPCKKCESTFSTVEQLQKHVDSAHNSVAKERMFICQVEGCSKACLTQKNLSLHIDEVHKQVRKAKCGKCGQMFRRGSHLTAHLKTKWACAKARGEVQPGRKTIWKAKRVKTEKCKSYPKFGTKTMPSQKIRSSERLRSKGKKFD
ncbi:putative zinc finger protein [Orchesella cincta]|uniref:Putative zinc finger protein n=1 Tax=Orchesella cincta TaxID=48709 RepID=A0A1D2M3X5_ORCCI|nr:putative zinc finger protein [Orchesella cincta]